MVVGVLMVNPQCEWSRRMLEKCQVRFPVGAPAFRHFSTSGESRRSLLKNNLADSGAQFDV